MISHLFYSPCPVLMCHHMTNVCCCNVFVSDMFYEIKVLHKGSYQGYDHIGSKCYCGCNHLHQMCGVEVSIDMYHY